MQPSLVVASRTRRDCSLVVLCEAGVEANGAERALVAAGLDGTGDALVAVERDRAETIVRTMLRFGLAYREECVAGDEASAAAAEFTELVGPGARFLTNRLMDGVSEDRPLGEGWNPVSSATFDAAVIGLGDGIVALIAVRDED